MNAAHDTDVRPARLDDLELIADIESAAGALFADAGMPEISQHAPTPLDDLRMHMDDHSLLIAIERGRVVGFATVIVAATNAHLDQMAVHPAYAWLCGEKSERYLVAEAGRCFDAYLSCQYGAPGSGLCRLHRQNG